LIRAEVRVSQRQFLLGCGVTGLALAACFMLILPPALAGVVGILAGIFGPITYLRRKHAARVAAFTAQLPDALELMMRGLRVGHPVSVTIRNVARTMPDPIGAEFRKLADQINHGDYLTEAFRDLADRMGQEDMDYLSVSLSIQHGTGGNLAEMLGTLSKVIRDRIMMRRRVKAISAEGRISAMLLSCLPVLIYVATTLSAPTYYGDVMDSPYFMPIAGTIVALVVSNALALYKLTNFRM
jgi:tight adherence protein B